MAGNNRIFYATQAVALKGQAVTAGNIAPTLNNSWYYPRGVQSVGMTTNFSLEQVFQMGQIEVYDQVENVPEVEVTMSKVIDGTPTLYALCMLGNNAINYVNNKELVALANNRVNFRLGIYGDTLSAATGTPSAYVDCSGMYLSSVSYTIPVEGNATEDVTLVGNNKVWNSGSVLAQGTPSSNGAFGGSVSGGLMTAPSLGRRYKLSLANCSLPTGLINGKTINGGIPLIDGSGYPHLQSITMSTSLGREPIYELGRMAPYFRYVTFPIEVTSEFQVIASSGDYVEANDFSSYASSCDTVYKNLADLPIKIVMCGSGNPTNPTANSLTIDLGTKNKLTSVNYNGGDTGGGNATVTYSYRTFNKFVIDASGTFSDYKWVDNTDDTEIVGD